MATVGKQGRQQKREPTVAPPAEAAAARWRRLAAAAAALAVLLWLLPVGVAHTPLLVWGINRLADLEGTVSVQSASLGWFSPIVLSGIEVRDVHNQPAWVAAELKSSKSLAAILCNLKSVGAVPAGEVADHGGHVQRPHRYSRKCWRSRIAFPPVKPVGLSLEVVDGGVAISDQEDGAELGAGRSSASA